MMITIALSFLIGTLFLQVFSQLLPVWSFVLILIALSIMTLIYKKKSPKKCHFNKYYYSSVFAFILGSMLATFHAQMIINNRLLPEWEGKEILLQGSVHNLPENRADGIRFRLNIEKAFLQSESKLFDQAIELKGKIRLGWFKNAKNIQSGESWQLKVRMKRPSGFLNPGGFDYEKWLFTQRIIATGYVRKSLTNENKRLSKSPWWSVDHLRQNIHESIQNTIEDKSSSAVISALVVANRSKLSEQQWKQLQQTGTSHLIAISGLHIAVVAGFGFLPVFLIWWLFPRLNEKIPLRIAGGIIGMLFAIIYSLLAGFTLPTQRALLMVIIGIFGLILRQNYSSSTILAIAMLAVLFLDPLAGLTISFWLSFLAVGLILILLKRQIKKPRFRLIKLQIILSLGMLPLTLLFFNSASLTSPVANLFAIPWVSFIVVPLSLLGLVFMPISGYISDAIFSVSAFAIHLLFIGLSYLSEFSINHLSLAGIPSAYLVIAFLGLLFLLLPKGFPARWLGLLAFIPALLFTVDKPTQGEFRFTLLDAGQGMASVVQTANHTLVYDTGTRMSKTFDIGKLVVIPYLKEKRVQQIDTMIISHDDIDHTGGANAILSAINTNRILGSEIINLKQRTVEACQAGSSWHWDGVDFELLSPLINSSQSNKQLSDNNLSCVLRITNGKHSLLLTGDIEKRIEKELIRFYGDKLKSSVISVPHHGSKTSSSNDFLAIMSPELALIPTGYRNRFGHPKPSILSRYEEHGIKVMDTVTQGAITVSFPRKDPIDVESFRKLKKGFWSRQ